MTEADSTQARWARTEALFQAALELPDSTRADFLRRCCGDDAALLREVESLLVAAGAHTGALAVDRVVGFDSAAHQPSRELASGALLGHWRVLNLIGRGGMGEVYLCERTGGEFEQKAALKLMRAEAGDHLLRFHTERQVLARLEHPGIARLLDGGTAEDGRPYMVMEYISGLPLAEYCRRHTLDLQARLDLFQQVCEAVAYAHANLVVHRDLKSANVLVTESGQVKLLDFGIAKLLGQDLRADMTQAAPLTPDCAAPEQLAGQPITTATDVYALGVLLHELLTGNALWDFRTTPIASALQRLLHETPKSPSESARENPAAPVAARLLDGDLDAIVAQALRKEPELRYQTAAELSAELLRYTRGEPVMARGDATGYILRRFLRRYRVPAIFAALFVLALMGGLAASLILYQQAREAETVAQREAATAKAVSNFLTEDLFAAVPNSKTPVRDMTVGDLLQRAAEKIDAKFSDQPAVAAEAHRSLSLSILNLNGLSDQVVSEMEKAAQLFEKAYGRDDERTEDALSWLASMLQNWNYSARAEAINRELYERRLARNGPGHPKTLESRMLLAWLRYRDGDIDLAASELRAVVAGGEVAEPQDAELLETARWNLAIVLSGIPVKNETTELLKRVLESREKRLPPQSKEVNFTRERLARALMADGRFDEAEAMLQRSLEDVRHWSGDNDRDIELMYRAFVALRLAQQRPREALEFLQKSRAILASSSFVAKDRGLAHLRYLEGQAWYQLGELDQAEAGLRENLEVLAKIETPKSWNTVSSRAELAILLCERGRYGEAQSLLDQNVPEALALIPKSGGTRALLMQAQAQIWLAQGQRDKGLTALQRAVHMLEQHYHPKHRNLQGARRALERAVAGS